MLMRRERYIIFRGRIMRWEKFATWCIVWIECVRVFDGIRGLIQG